MTLRPAHEVILTHAGNSVVLRASLGAAVAMNALPGGLPAVLDQIAGQNFTTITNVIRATATDRLAAERLLTSLHDQPLEPFVQRAQSAILEVISAILPASEEAATAQPDAPVKPWAEHFKELYGFGTGWLGWTPETTWNASVQEITAAFEGHTERLITMNGGSRDSDTDHAGTPTASNIYSAEQLAQIEEQGFDPTFDRAGLRALRARNEA
ncbi:MAG TPA: hypothetical protein GXX24_09430 [Paracoccus solventivorans]|uniref:Phage tail assembly chaperone protein, TAC n=1 Tax=Paracoccus solventivorans TaxID=53463 RepID=A0A832PMZ3_9RHOB|nr:hypothetical protein [Paracoccus solventivorans]HHW34342.1 hypothetical protein [Paracoccus solventivorans]